MGTRVRQDSTRTRCAPYPVREDDAHVEFTVGIFVQVAGSLLVLAGFALVQWGVFGPKSRVYLLLNAVGSAVLAVDAWFGRQWGFLLLEGVWAIVSTVSLVRVLTKAGSGSAAVHSDVEQG